MTHAEADDVRATLDRETDLLLGAIRLVATGGARSADIAGLRLAESAMAIARPEAEALGLVLSPLWRPDESGCDVHVGWPK